MKKSRTTSTRKTRVMPMKKVSRVLDIQKNNQIKTSFTGVPETDMRACFNRSTWSPAINMQHPPTGTSNWIFGKSLVSVAEIENHMDHYDDGIRRCHIRPTVLKV